MPGKGVRGGLRWQKHNRDGAESAVNQTMVPHCYVEMGGMGAWDCSSIKTTMESVKSVNPSFNWVGGATLNVPLPLSLVKCKSDMLPCLHWLIQRSWGVSIMFINMFLHYWKVLSWLDGKKKKRKSLRRLFVMANQCISLLKSRGKHRCIYSSHFSDHSNPPPCIPHVNTAAARVSCLISQTVHALSLFLSLKPCAW